MRWSKLKQRIEDRFAEGLKGRLHIYETRQRMGHNHNLGEVWLTLDKERIFSTSDMKGWQRVQQFLDDGNSYEEAFEKTGCEGTLPIDQSNQLLFASLNMSIEEMLNSTNVLIRGLGIADARCGRRRRTAIESDIATEHDFIRRVFAERNAREPID